MKREQFIWKGNGPTTGIPLVPTNRWPAIRRSGVLWASKNLLWMFGGADTVRVYADFSTYSDGMVTFIH